MHRPAKKIIVGAQGYELAAEIVEWKATFNVDSSRPSDASPDILQTAEFGKLRSS